MMSITHLFCGRFFNVTMIALVRTALCLGAWISNGLFSPCVVLGGAGRAGGACTAAADLCYSSLASKPTCSQLQLFLSKRKKEMTPRFLPICSLTAQMLPAAGMAWTMTREQSRLLVTGGTDIDGEIEKGMRMVSPVPFSPFFAQEERFV